MAGLEKLVVAQLVKLPAFIMEPEKGSLNVPFSQDPSTGPYPVQIHTLTPS
jgi:hypothetical protein